LWYDSSLQGRSFKTMLTELRISNACRLLLNSNEFILDH